MQYLFAVVIALEVPVAIIVSTHHHISSLAVGDQVAVK